VVLIADIGVRQDSYAFCKRNLISQRDPISQVEQRIITDKTIITQIQSFKTSFITIEKSDLVENYITAYFNPDDF